jgi:hypothetical protein
MLDPVPDPVQVQAGAARNIPLSVSNARRPCDKFVFSLSTPNPQIPVPPFVRLTDNGDGTGMLRLTPGPNDIGSYLLTVIVADRSAPPQTANQTITIHITP